MEKHLKIILEKMCEFVGAKFDEIEFTTDWFLQYEWTAQEQKVFEDWLFDYLYTNQEARQELMRFPQKNKALIKQVVLEFTAQYGWKFKPEES